MFMLFFLHHFACPLQELSHLPYSSFLATLDDIAIQHSDVRRLADAAAAATLEESVAVLARTTPAASVATRRIDIFTENGSGNGFGRRPESGNGHASASRPETGRDVTHRADNHSGETIDTGKTTHGHKFTAEGGGAGDQGERGAGKTQKSRENSGKAASASRTGGRSSPNAKKSGVARGDVGAAGMAVAATLSTSAGSADVETIIVEGFRPDDQRLLILLQKYILVKSNAGKEVSESGPERAAMMVRDENFDDRHTCLVCLT